MAKMTFRDIAEGKSATVKVPPTTQAQKLTPKKPQGPQTRPGTLLMNERKMKEAKAAEANKRTTSRTGK